MRAGCRPFVEDDKQRIERPADSNDNGDLSSGGSEHPGGFLSGNTSRPDPPSAQIHGVFGPRKTTRLCGVALSTRLLDLLGWIGDRLSLGPSVYVRIYNAFGSLCTAQRKLPSFNKALRRGLQTRTSCTWGLSRSHSQACPGPFFPRDVELASQTVDELQDAAGLGFDNGFHHQLPTVIEDGDHDGFLVHVQADIMWPSGLCRVGRGTESSGQT
jgi:hypothetical protein